MVIPFKMKSYTVPVQNYDIVSLRLYVKNGERSANKIIEHYQPYSKVLSEMSKNRKTTEAISKSAIYKDGKFYDTQNLRVLPESEFDSPYLNPEDNWLEIKNMLALPEEFRIFNPNDEFIANPMNLAPYYVSRGTKMFRDKECECDRYLADIKSLAGTTLAQEAYDALYSDGKLVGIKRYFIRDGKEKLVNVVDVDTISGTVHENAFKIIGNKSFRAARAGDIRDLIDESSEVVEVFEDPTSDVATNDKNEKKKKSKKEKKK